MAAPTKASACRKEQGQPYTMDLCRGIVSCESVIRKECNETGNKNEKNKNGLTI
jgi:hypothetical protein